MPTTASMIPAYYRTAAPADGIAEPPAETEFPPYYGLQMVNLLVGPGGGLLGTTTDQKMMIAHAVRQSNGFMAIMLINEDPSRTGLVNINLYGAQVASNAVLYTYGNDNLPSTTGASKPVAKATIYGMDSTYFLHIRPYTIGVLLVKIIGTRSEQSG